MGSRESRPAGEERARHTGSRKGSAALAAAVGGAGTILLFLLVGLCLPLTIPRVFGYQIYSVVSGSMEPAIPVGSLLYIEKTAPEEVAEGDVIAFCGAGDSASIITHRVVENRIVMGEFITRGDANEAEDMNPVPYENLMGRVRYTLPRAGRAAERLVSRQGKALAGGVIAAAVVLQLLASVIRRRGL